MDDIIFIADIGTTTVSAAVLDSKKRRVIDFATTLNKQTEFGEDVITRIDFAIKNKKNRSVLQRAAIDSINQLIGSFRCKPNKAFIAANSAIHHLTLKIDPLTLVRPPYKPKKKSEIITSPEKIGLKLPKNCKIVFLPLIGGYVGSDALAVIISSGIYKSKETRLAVDIGTNGEVVLGRKGKIFVASTAAGPAFEGRAASCGMPAKTGAIDSFRIVKGQPFFNVIGNTKPMGICASALIDAAYQFLKNGIMDKSGRLCKNEFVVYENETKKISVTQRDLRNLQLAKAAISAAVTILSKYYGIGYKDIKEALITGSFGSKLNKASVIGTGLLPLTTKVGFLQHGALKGLEIYALDPSLQKNISKILKMTRHIPLFGKDFPEIFTSSMLWRHNEP